MHEENPTELHGSAEEQYIETVEETQQTTQSITAGRGKVVIKKHEENHRFAHIAHFARVLGAAPQKWGQVGQVGIFLISLTFLFGPNL